MTPTVADDDLRRAQRRYHVAKTTGIILAVLGAIAFSVMMLLLVVGINRAQDAIADCTSPGGTCYQRSVGSAQRGGANLDQTYRNARNLMQICAAVKADCEPIPAAIP